MMNRDLNDQQLARREKASNMRNLGVEPFQPKFSRSHTSGKLMVEKENLLLVGSEISYAGRVVRLNRKGKLAFMHLKDEWGRVQAVMGRSEVGAESYEIVKSVDLGDWVGVRGSMFMTHSGEYSIKVILFQMLSKALRPLPIPKEKLIDNGQKITFDPLSDTETRYRQRYLDLALNDQVRNIFRRRSAIVRSIRSFLDSLEFLEVETPILQPIYGGANARPFVTRHHAQGMELYLRVSNELYLKRCIIGGFERVYEFARDFRNEGIDRTHNPEFTLLEIYEAYADYYAMMDRVEQMVVHAAISTGAGTKIEWDGRTIDVGRPWRRIQFLEAIATYTGIDASRLDLHGLRRMCSHQGYEVDPYDGRGETLIGLFEQAVVPNLIQPHIVYDFPKESSPLCRRHRSNGEFIEQFELYIGGMEICNAYSELIDPVQQRDAFEQQAHSGRGHTSR